MCLYTPSPRNVSVCEHSLSVFPPPTNAPRLHCACKALQVLTLPRLLLRTATVQVNLEGNSRLQCRQSSNFSSVKVACGSVVSPPTSEISRAAPVATPVVSLSQPTSRPKRGHIAAVVLSVVALVGVAAVAVVLWRRQQWLGRQRGLRPYIDPTMQYGTFEEASRSEHSRAQPAEADRLAEM
jgi:hypothetical protein